MKKTITTALAALAFFGATAADMTVYDNGQLATGVEAMWWWNATYVFDAANPAGGDTKVFSLKATDEGTDASMGLLANGSQAVTGPLHSATLSFSWYAKAPATYTVRLTADTGSEEDYTWTVTEADINKWNETTLSVATDFPKVAKDWNDYVGKGRGYVFGLVMANGQADSEIFVNNIRYVGIDEAWKAPATSEIVPPTTVPAIPQDRTDVLPVFCAYGTATFNIGGWGQATQADRISIAGVDVMKMVRFNYLGWELNPSLDATGYDYMHVDFYPCEKTNFGFTPISPGPKEKSWIVTDAKVNEWNSYDVALSEFPIDLDNIFQIKFDQGNTGAECYLANVYFWKKQGGEEPVEPDPVVPGATYKGTVNGSVEQESKEYPYTMDYSIVYNEDKTLTITANYVFTDGEPFGVIPGYVYINNMENGFVQDGSVRKLTTTATYEPNESLSLRFYVPGGAGAIMENTVNYNVGESNITTSITDEIEVSEGVAEYYTLQGVRVANPEKGLYIKVLDGKAVKVIL